MKRRKDCAFGLHFDFHAHPIENGPAIGETLTEENIRAICRTVKPDFIQIDCKGHPGWASYPTKLGNAMPKFAQDTLKLWRRVTKEEGVGLFMHYSGVVDNKYCAEHPEEAILQADGKRSPSTTRTFTQRYARELLIPQLEELAGVYGVDGVWIDGECWGTAADFDPETVAGFEKATGIQLNGTLPVKRGDFAYDEYRDYCRQLFRDYVNLYVETVHAKYPDFQIASNWAFSDHMPEKVCANVDYISGDFNPWSSVNSARYAGRAIAQQKMPWDLMSWNFRSKMGDSTPYYCVKAPAQMMQEAAAVASLGGGYQNYIIQYPDGSPRMEQILRMKQVGDMVRARQDYCFRAETVQQVAVLLSTYDRYQESDSLFSRNGNDKIAGVTSLLCDCGQVNSIFSEHEMQDALTAPVIVVPELYKGLEDSTVRAFLDYAQKGGSLLLCGCNTCRFFEQKGAPICCGEYTEKNRFFTCEGIDFASVYGSISIQGADAALVSDTARSAQEGFAGVFPYVKGKIACIGADIGTAYTTHAQEGHRELMNKILKLLYKPVVEITDSEGTVELNLLKKNGTLLVQMVNMNGDHTTGTRSSYNKIQACRDIKMLLRTNASKLILRPEGTELAFTRTEDGLVFTVDRVDMHEIIEVVQ